MEKPQDYDSVPPTMITLVIYPKEKFPMRDLFFSMPIDEIIPEKNRKGDPVRTSICGKNGLSKADTVFSSTYGNLCRGTPMFSNKKTWCSQCRLTEKLPDGQVKKIMTRSRILSDTIEKFGETFYKCKISSFYCHNCKNTFYPQDAKSLTTFPTQIGVYYSLGTHYIHAMIFKKKEETNKIKLAGCKSYEDGKKFVEFIYYKCLLRKNIISIKPTSMIIEGAVRNKKFLLPFSVDREKLVELFSRPAYSKEIANATFMPGSQTSANIKMRHQREKKEIYELTLTEKSSRGEIKVVAKNDVEKKLEEKFIIFIVFTSSDANPNRSVFQVTGKDFLSHRLCYEFFMKVVTKNRKYIEENFDG